MVTLVRLSPPLLHAIRNNKIYNRKPFAGSFFQRKIMKAYKIRLQKVGTQHHLLRADWLLAVIQDDSLHISAYQRHFSMIFPIR